MPDPTAPLACGHDRSELWLENNGATHCRRCGDLASIDNSKAICLLRLGAALRELTRVRSERDKAELRSREAARCYEADIGKLKDACEETQADLEAAQDLVFEMFGQAHGIIKNNGMHGYDHFCESVGEQIQRYLISIGRVKPEECVRI